MDSTLVDHYQKQLQALAEKMRSVVSSVTEQSHAAVGGHGSGELTQTPFHLADTGTEEYLYDLNNTLLVNEEFLANEVRDALQRIQDGTYGQCENCGKTILPERLDAIPFTRFCVRCAAEVETSPVVNVNAGRPRSPKDTLAPEGEMSEDTHDVLQPELAIVDVESERDERAADIHAAGTAGGGTAIGGLAGTNIGRGDPHVADLQDATASSEFDVDEVREEERQVPRSGPSGGAVGGTPAGKRSR